VFAHKKEEADNLWRARKEAFWASTALRPGADILTTDVCVPISR
jgi:D-lactate dehydrogenase (cytochrome)